ncbi:MAG: hypothetical protein IKG69_07090 [Atopobiaceae bacterium]|nr:hypothetical protein [Atopobiaceae bacterium]MBR3384950.1 hypothetical protein [Atopobiaceae bacterium]
MNDNTKTMHEAPENQAIITDLLFGEKAGLAAMSALDGNIANEVTTIYPEANAVVHIDAEATRMLARAQMSILDSREAGMFVPKPNRINHYELNEPKEGAREFFMKLADILANAMVSSKREDEAAEIDMSEVTPGNTEKVYTDQPIPKREQ